MLFHQLFILLVIFLPTLVVTIGDYSDYEDVEANFANIKNIKNILIAPTEYFHIKPRYNKYVTIAKRQPDLFKQGHNTNTNSEKQILKESNPAANYYNGSYFLNRNTQRPMPANIQSPRQPAYGSNRLPKYPYSAGIAQIARSTLAHTGQMFGERTPIRFPGKIPSKISPQILRIRPNPMDKIGQYTNNAGRSDPALNIRNMEQFFSLKPLREISHDIGPIKPEDKSQENSKVVDIYVPTDKKGNASEKIPVIIHPVETMAPYTDVATEVTVEAKTSEKEKVIIESAETDVPSHVTEPAGDAKPSENENQAIPEHAPLKKVYNMYEDVPGWYEVKLSTKLTTTEVALNNTEELEPLDEGTVLGDEEPIPWTTTVATTTVEPRPLGALTAPLAVILQNVVTKDWAAVTELVRTLKEVIDSMYRGGELDQLGHAVALALVAATSALVHWTETEFREKAIKGKEILDKGATGMHPDKLEYLENVYNKQESDDLWLSVDLITFYPQNNVTSQDVVIHLLKSLVAPFKRTFGSVYTDRFIKIINTEVLKRYVFRRHGNDTLGIVKRQAGNIGLATEVEHAKNESHPKINDKMTKVDVMQTKNDSLSKLGLKAMIEDGLKNLSKINRERKVVNGQHMNLSRINSLTNNRQDNTNTPHAASKVKSGKAFVLSKKKNNIRIDKKKIIGKGFSTAPRKIKTPMRFISKQKIKQHLKEKHSKIYNKLKKGHQKKKNREKKSKTSRRLKTKTDLKNYDRLKENEYAYENVLKNKILKYFDKTDLENIVKGNERIEPMTKKAQKRFNVVTPKTQSSTNFLQNINEQNTTLFHVNQTKRKEKTEDPKNDFKIDDEVNKSEYLQPVQLISGKEEVGFRQKNLEESKKVEAKRKELLKKILEESSYSDDEKDLKRFLSDAIRHGDTVFKNFRKSNVEREKKSVINEMTSYSDEEAILKNNIYKTFGYNAELEKRNL